MAKSNFLLVDLNETKTKKLASTITSDTSRKILNYLAEKEHDTEAKIAATLKMPISTVHYHLQKLQEAGLVTVEEFHYSKKGREVNHYMLANKYIIIAPKKVSGLREKLKSILPAGIVVVGVSAVMKIVEMMQQNVVAGVVMEESAAAVPLAAEKVAPMMADAVTVVETKPDLALWFLLGGTSVILLYLLIEWIKEKIKK